MTKFRCENCGYGFESQSQKKKCPYCAQDKVREDGDVEKILEEI